MDAAGEQWPGGRVDKAVTLQGRQPGEAFRDDVDGKMGAFPCAGMAGVGGAVVTQLQPLWRKRLAQCGFQLLCQRAHLPSLPDICSQAIWPIRNANIVAIIPHIFTFTQVDSAAL